MPTGRGTMVAYGCRMMVALRNVLLDANGCGMVVALRNVLIAMPMAAE